MSEILEKVKEEPSTDDEWFISCRFCKNVFKNSEEFTKHFCRNLRKKFLYSCYACKRHFSDLNVLSEHISHHPRKKFYKCYFCKKDFKNLTEQRNHIMLHKLSNSNETLSDKFHLINLNNEVKDKIDEGNQTISTVKGNQLVNTGEETYICSICNVTFPNITELAGHKCEKPDKHYSLRSDKKKKHCYLCNNCNRSCESDKFYSKSYLGLCKHCQTLRLSDMTSKIHKTPNPKSIDLKKVMMAMDSDRPNEDDPKTWDKSLFVCIKCNKEFNDIDGFKKHEAMHQKRKNFMCKICTGTYRTLHELIGHMKTHPEYGLRCEKCKLMFSDITKYEEHKMGCDDISDYYCSVCDKSFASFVELKKHNVECEKFLRQFETVQKSVAIEEACKDCGKDIIKTEQNGKTPDDDKKKEEVKVKIEDVSKSKNSPEKKVSEDVIGVKDSEDNQMFTELLNDLFTCDDCLETKPNENIVSCDNCLENIPSLLKNVPELPKYEITRKSPRMFEIKYSGVDHKNGKIQNDNKASKSYNQKKSKTKEGASNESETNLVDWVNDGGDESQIVDDKKLLDLLDEIDFPEMGGKQAENSREFDAFKCDVCSEEFEYYNDLEVHRYIHEEKNSFICPDCRNGFLDLFQLETHKCGTKR